MELSNRKILTSFFVFNLLFIITANSSVIFQLSSEWSNSGPYNHGFLGFALVLYCVGLKRDAFRHYHFNPITLVFVAATCLLQLIANLASIGQLQHLTLFLITTALLTSVYGFKIIKTLFLPLAMLALIFPFWNILQLPLREISTWVSFHSVQLLGFEIIRNGYQLSTPEGIFIVEEACSGLAFFLVSTLYAFFITQLNHLTRKEGLTFITLAMVVAIIANWIRIIVIVIVGSQTQMQHFIVTDHLTFGWFVFAACFMPIIILGQTYFRGRITAEAAKVTTGKQQLNIKQLIAVSAILLSFTATSVWISSRFNPHYRFAIPELPNYQQITNNNLNNPNWQPLFIGASSEHFSYFSNEHALLQIYLANYAQQQQGQEMINVGNKLFNKHRWSQIEQSELFLNTDLPLNKIPLITLKRDQHHGRLIVYWYVINNHFISDKKWAKWHEVIAKVKGQPEATLVAIALDYDNSDKNAALKTITDFATSFIEEALAIRNK